MPPWLKRSIGAAGRKGFVERELSIDNLHTVCVEARCPNRGECFGRGTATFLILGSGCTRHCAFCHVRHDAPQPLDLEEPENLLRAVKHLGLSYVVITSVTRDDLADGGAGQYARSIRLLKENIPEIRVEVLIPDLQGDRKALFSVLKSLPDVLNHNLETVPRLYSSIRPQADYQRSLLVLSNTAEYNSDIFRKSGLMVGLGEREDEVFSVMTDLLHAGCQMLTIGQYLQPSPEQVPVREFISPEQFAKYSETGKKWGFLEVFAGPYVRSSYRADEIAGRIS